MDEEIMIPDDTPITENTDDEMTDAADEPTDEPIGEENEASDEAESDSVDELEALRAEVESLRAQLNEERAVYSRVNSECNEFARLYPEIPLSSLSEDIWESVKRGVPIAAAYALEERRAAVANMKANTVNENNRRLSSGSVDRLTAEEYFSPDEVRAMTPGEVRANYSKIISSMSKWH